MKRHFIPLAIISLVVANAAYARQSNFVTPAQVRALQILPAPPSNDSAITAAELKQLHELQTTRTVSQVIQATADDKDETVFLFRNVLGEGFNSAALPITSKFTERVKKDAGAIASPAKTGFLRIHPYNLDKTLQPVCETKLKHDSYPSGHTFAGYLLALTLIDMVPEKRDAILARAADYANNRLICGVQYQSDLQASKLLAYSTFALLASNPQYQTELAAAKLELRKALGNSIAGN